MTKTEQNLIEAIEAKDYDLALEQFELFQALKNTTDEQAELYFKQIEGMNNDAPKVEEVQEPVKEVESVEEEMPPLEEMSLTQLRGAYPNIKATSKSVFIGKVKEFLISNIGNPSETTDEQAGVQPETRGRKAKDVDRKEIENDLESLINKTLAFNQKVSRNGNGDARFAKRISRELVNIRKRLVR